jgi:hypothetical protein
MLGERATAFDPDRTAPERGPFRETVRAMSPCPPIPFAPVLPVPEEALPAERQRGPAGRVLAILIGLSAVGALAAFLALGRPQAEAGLEARGLPQSQHVTSTTAHVPTSDRGRPSHGPAASGHGQRGDERGTKAHPGEGDRGDTGGTAGGGSSGDPGDGESGAPATPLATVDIPGVASVTVEQPSLPPLPDADVPTPAAPDLPDVPDLP